MNYMKKCKLGCNPCKHLKPLFRKIRSGKINMKRESIRFECLDLHIHCVICDKTIHLSDNGSGVYYHE